MRFDQNELIERIKAQVQEAYLGPNLVETQQTGGSAGQIQYLTGEVDKLKKVLTHLIQDGAASRKNPMIEASEVTSPNHNNHNSNGNAVNVQSPQTPDAPRRRGRPPGSGSAKKTSFQ